MIRWDSTRIDARDAMLIRGLYPTLRSFAGVVAPTGDPDEIVVEALGMALEIGALSSLPDPAENLRGLILRLALSARPPWPRRIIQLVSTGGPAVLRMRARTRAALYLEVIEGLTSDEIGRTIGTSASAARRIAERARARLSRVADRGAMMIPEQLAHLAGNGEPLTDHTLRARLNARLAAAPPLVVVARSGSPEGPAIPSRGPLVAGAAAALVFAVAVGAAIASQGSDDARQAAAQDRIEPALLAAAGVQPRPPITLTPNPAAEPTRIATAIGDVELTTFAYSTESWFSGMVTTSFGPVAAPGLRWSDDYLNWHDITIGYARLAADGDDVLTYGSIGGDGEGLGMRLTWTGDGWSQAAELELPGPADQIVVGARAVVAVDESTLEFTGERWESRPGMTVYTSDDGIRFTEASRPPLPGISHVPPFRPVPRPARSPVKFGEFAGGCAFGAWSTGSDPVFATAEGFIAMTAREPQDWAISPICEPQLWFSSDGDRWEPVGGDAPFGATAAVSAVAQHDGRYVAFGRIGTRGTGGVQPTLWVSADGIDWDRIDAPVPATAAIAGGELGWVLIGTDEAGAGLELWVSTDAVRWDGPHDIGDALGTHYRPYEIVVTADRVIALSEGGVTVGTVLD